MDKKKKLRRIYKLLDDHFGDLGWWPAETPFEVIIGAVLTQNTAWSNVEKAIKRLKEENLVDPLKIIRCNTARLSSVIRPSGYHRVKSGRLKEVSRFLVGETGGDLLRFRKESTAPLREKLLGVKGIGQETADSILLYAFNRPVFVVDAYTIRIFSRHGMIGADASYEHVQRLVHGDFPVKTAALKQFHALLVETGKVFCRKRKGICGECPLRPLL